MKWLASWVVSTGLVLAASSTNAQMSTPYAGGQAHYQAASDFEGPYVGGPPVPMPAPLLTAINPTTATARNTATVRR